MGRKKLSDNPAPDVAIMDLTWRDDELVFFTRYKGHRFDGWISTASMQRAEADGVLAWDADGRPVIDPSRLREGDPS